MSRAEEACCGGNVVGFSGLGEVEDIGPSP